jgi:hypothetical protein
LSWGVSGAVCPFLFSGLLDLSGMALWWTLAALMLGAAGVFTVVRARARQPEHEVSHA